MQAKLRVRSAVGGEGKGLRRAGAEVGFPAFMCALCFICGPSERSFSLTFVERLIAERGKEVLSMIYIFDVLQLCILVITLISYSDSPLTLFWGLWGLSVCLTLLKSLQRSADDLLLLIYMAPSRSSVAAACRNYGPSRTT